MTIIFTDQSLLSLEQSLEFLHSEFDVPIARLLQLNQEIFDCVKPLEKQPHLGQIEPKLSHLNLGHRRLIYKNFKIVYRVFEDHIFVTDIFDSRQSPHKMKK